MPTDRKETDFVSLFKSSCINSNVCYKRWLKKILNGSQLKIALNKMTGPVINPLLEALSRDRTLRHIKISFDSDEPASHNKGHAITLKANKERFPKYIVSQVCIVLQKVLANNANLSNLQLIGFNLTSTDIKRLCLGLCKGNLHHLSFQSIPLLDRDVEKICQSLKSVHTLKHLEFVDCSLSANGSKAVASLIESHAMERRTLLWQEGLRCNCPNLEVMSGIERISLNGNPKIQDEGVLHWVNVLQDDLWLKAIDMQNCGITNAGAKALKTMLNKNNTLLICDVRNNAIDEDIVNNLLKIILKRDHARVKRYDWKPPVKIEDQVPETQFPVSAELSSAKSSSSESERMQAISLQNAIEDEIISPIEESSAEKSSSKLPTEESETPSLPIVTQEQPSAMKEDTSVASISETTEPMSVAQQQENIKSEESEKEANTLSEKLPEKHQHSDALNEEDKSSLEGNVTLLKEKQEGSKGYISVSLGLLKSFFDIAKLIEESHLHIFKLSENPNIAQLPFTTQEKIKESVQVCKVKLQNVEGTKPVDLPDVALASASNHTVISEETLHMWKQNIERIEELFL